MSQHRRDEGILEQACRCPHPWEVMKERSFPLRYESAEKYRLPQDLAGSAEETIMSTSLVLPWEASFNIVSASLASGRNLVACHEDQGCLPNPSV
ncbi:hypothetical protein LIER_39617 [Lithospermum erythrorhizon]|uniref:Uncharacterized protein n=1 Tax=Lithospermum erythrorhizon TaxID=34254 RepID=A0AAV3QKJ1_LITER